MYTQDEAHRKLVEKLREKCEQKGYTYYVLAKKANISTSTMYNIMNGKTMPQFFTLLTLCNVLEISMDEVFGNMSIEEILSSVDEELQEDLNKDERELLSSYRNLSGEKKEWLNFCLKMLEQYEKRE